MMTTKQYIFSLLVFVFLLKPSTTLAQFAPAAGQPGTTAMHKDSSAFIGWATSCTVYRGWQNIDNTSAGYTSAGDSTMVLGMAGTGGIVSLGDRGSAICRFDSPLLDGPGFDFAVFENSFSDDFLELAVVEVSSDGINFFRFPPTSLRQDTVQVSPFDSVADAKLLNNLAGKYRVFYGTPFDLQELNGVSGLDVNNITHVKIIDVVGSIDPAYATYDQYGTAINEPWPTEFPTGGFDLDAVGVIHSLSAVNEHEKNPFRLYPNPCNDVLYLSGNKKIESITIDDLNGKTVISENNFTGNRLSVSVLPKGIYFIAILSGDGVYNCKLIKN